MDEQKYITEKVSALPKVKQDFILSDTWQNSVDEIVAKFNLNENQMRILSTEVIFIMLGEGSLTTLASALEEDGQIEDSIALEIVALVNQNILKDYRNLKEESVQPEISPEQNIPQETVAKRIHPETTVENNQNGYVQQEQPAYTQPAPIQPVQPAHPRNVTPAYITKPVAPTPQPEPAFIPAPAPTFEEPVFYEEPAPTPAQYVPQPQFAPTPMQAPVNHGINISSEQAEEGRRTNDLKSALETGYMPNPEPAFIPAPAPTFEEPVFYEEPAPIPAPQPVAPIRPIVNSLPPAYTQPSREGIELDANKKYEETMRDSLMHEIEDGEDLIPFEPEKGEFSTRINSGGSYNPNSPSNGYVQAPTGVPQNLPIGNIADVPAFHRPESNQTAERPRYADPVTPKSNPGYDPYREPVN